MELRVSYYLILRVIPSSLMIFTLGVLCGIFLARGPVMDMGRSPFTLRWQRAISVPTNMSLDNVY